MRSLRANVVAEKSPKKLPLKSDDQKTSLLMRDSYVAAMAYLWSLALPKAISLLEANIATTDDAEFALRFVAIRIRAERGEQDVADLLALPLDQLLADLDEERSIAELEKRRRQIDRTGSLLHGHSADLERFILDDGYRAEILARLVHSVDVNGVTAALSLAALHNHDPGPLFAQHLEFVLKSDDPRHHFEQLGATVKSVSGPWFEQVFATVDGTDYTRLSYLYELKSGQADLPAPVRSRLQKHISILSRLACGRIALDYKVVLGGGADAYLSVRAAVNDRTVAILARVASRLRELQEAESVPALTESTILIDYLAEVLLSRPPPPASYRAFVDLYGQYLSRLSLSDFAEVLRKVSHSQMAVDFVSNYVSENVDADDDGS